MQEDFVDRRHQAEVVCFLEAHRAAIAELVEKAYLQAGGHYAQMSAGGRREQAERDAEEIVAHICAGEISAEAIEASIRAIPSLAILNDVMHMAEAIERLTMIYLRQQLADDPDLCREVVHRASNTSRRFRVSVSTVYAERVRARLADSSQA
jgi:hypothetical protein